MIILKNWKKNHLRMKLNKYLLFILILIYLINIKGNNSSIEIRNLERVNDNIRILNEQIDNYVIIEFKEDNTYNEGAFFAKYNYDGYLSYFKKENENEKFYPNSSFFVGKNTKLEVHFNESIKDLSGFLNCDGIVNLKHLISADFCHFDTSSAETMEFMFYGCSSLQTLYLSNLKHHQ